jgi:hypothetical protein
MPAILVLGRLRQEDYEFEVGLDNIKSSQKSINQTNKKHPEIKALNLEEETPQLYIRKISSIVYNVSYSMLA